MSQTGDRGDRQIGRRTLLRGIASIMAGSVLTACSPRVVEKVVEKEVTKVVKEVVKETVIVAATPEVVEKEVTRVVVAEAPVAASDQAVDWLHAEDISKMPPTEVRYWFHVMPERISLGKRQVKTFEKIFPNIKVDGRVGPYGVDNEKLLAYIKAGTSSHIHHSVCNEDGWYIHRDLLLPLDDLPGFAEVSDQLLTSANYTWKDGHAYGLSWYIEPQCMYYNKRLVVEAGLDSETPPTTYSEFLRWAETLTKVDAKGKTTQWFVNLPLAEEWWRWEFNTYPFYISASGHNQLHSQDGKKAVFNTPEALAAYQLISTLFEKGYNILESAAGNPFFSEMVAATLSGPKLLVQATQFAPPGFEFFLGPIPKPDDAKFEGFPTFNLVRELVLMREQGKTGKEADCINRAAWEFLKFLLSDEESAADFAVTGSLSASAKLLSDPLYTEILDSMGPGGKWIADDGQEGLIYDMNTHVACEAMAALQSNYLEMIFQRKTPAEALNASEEDVNAILASG